VEASLKVSWSNALEGIDWGELEALYRAAHLGNKNANDLKTVFTNSRFCCFAREGGRIVGAGRVLADGVDCAYLCDVAVLPEFQGAGLGKEIVRRLVASAEGHKKIILYAVPGKEPFYRKLGFRRMLTAMAIFESPAQAAERGYVESI
jgi:ribosomal protein S18 acetylase RimI-like enzyme